MGIVLIGYQISHPYSNLWNAADVNLGLPYFSISLALNILLTLMIVIRLILHNREVRTATGLTEAGGTYKNIVTMLVESSALYAVTSLLYIGPWGAGNHAADIFLPALCQIQVRGFSRPCLRISRLTRRRVYRLSPRCSSSNESPARAYWRETLPPTDVSVRLGAEGCRGVMVMLYLMRSPWVRLTSMERTPASLGLGSSEVTIDSHRNTYTRGQAQRASESVSRSGRVFPTSFGFTIRSPANFSFHLFPVLVFPSHPYAFCVGDLRGHA